MPEHENTPLPFPKRSIVSERSKDLVGFEPQTVAYDPRKPEELQQLRAVHADAVRRDKRVLLVRDKGGALTLWQHCQPFWPRASR